MADSPLLKIPLLSTSQSAKETTINTMVSYLERAMNDAQTIAMGGASVVLPATDLQRYFMFRLTGVGSGSTLNITRMKRLFVVENLTGAFDVSVNCGTSALTVPASAVVIIYCDGTNLISVADSTVMGGGSSGASTFITLLDTFSSYAGMAGRWLTVTGDEDGIEALERTLANLLDIDLTDIEDGFVLAWDATAEKWITVPQSSGGGGEDSGALVKEPVDAATVFEVVLNDDLIIGGAVDGVTLTEGMRILVKDQTDKKENGIWEITSSDPIRPAGADSTGDFIEGSLVVVRLGPINGLRVFLQTATAGPGGITPGSSDMEFQTSSGSLATLSDVDVEGVLAGQTIVWDDTTETWIVGNPAGELPSGGTTGQVLTKNSDTNQDASWQDPAGGAELPPGGSTGQVLTKNSSTENDASWQNIPKGKREISVFAGGKGINNETLLAYYVPSPLTIPSSAAGSIARALTAAAAATTYTLRKNGTSFGTITFASSGTNGTFTISSNTAFATGDILSITGPAAADVTLADVMITIKEL